MSRLDELRKKFSEKGRRAVEELTSPRGEFVAKLHEFTERTYKASSHDKEFEDALFQRFQTEEPRDIMEWLASVTSDLFRSALKPPNWVGEPDWCFHNGVPLEFLAQFSDDDDVVLYVFRGINEENRVFYKMRAWQGDDRIHLNGLIEG